MWIEGARLVASGFTVGARYDRMATSDELTGNCLTLALSPEGRYKVSGKGAHPIIDVTGATVVTLFAGCSHVAVRYSAGGITIVGVEA